MLNQPNKLITRCFIVFGLIFVLAACNNRPKGVLNQSEMTDVLTDLHKLDGSLSTKGYGSIQDTVNSYYYNSVLLKHDVTKAEFDSSLVWYTKNPKKFETIYADVLLQLTNLNEEVKKGKFHPVDSAALAKVKVNIWAKRVLYNLKKDSARTRLDFEIKDNNLLMGDVYILKFLQRIAPEDSCTKQHVVLRINYDNGKSDSVYQIAHNDSLLRRYTFRLPANKKLRIKSVSGSLLGSKVYKGKLNALVDSITLMREYNPEIQDSIRKMVDKANPKPRVNLVKIAADSLRRAKLSQKKINMKPLKPKD